MHLGRGCRPKAGSGGWGGGRGWLESKKERPARFAIRPFSPRAHLLTRCAAQPVRAALRRRRTTLESSVRSRFSTVDTSRSLPPQLALESPSCRPLFDPPRRRPHPQWRLVTSLARLVPCRPPREGAHPAVRMPTQSAHPTCHLTPPTIAITTGHLLRALARAQGRSRRREASARDRQSHKPVRALTGRRERPAYKPVSCPSTSGRRNRKCAWCWRRNQMPGTAAGRTPGLVGRERCGGRHAASGRAVEHQLSRLLSQFTHHGPRVSDASVSVPLKSRCIAYRTAREAHAGVLQSEPCKQAGQYRFPKRNIFRYLMNKR